MCVLLPDRHEGKEGRNNTYVPYSVNGAMAASASFAQFLKASPPFTGRAGGRGHNTLERRNEGASDASRYSNEQSASSVRVLSVVQRREKKRRERFICEISLAPLIRRRLRL